MKDQVPCWGRLQKKAFEEVSDASLRHSILGTLYYIRDFVCVPVEDKGDIDRTIAAIQEDPLKLAVWVRSPEGWFATARSSATSLAARFP